MESKFVDDVRIAVVGRVDAGKSTLIGTLVYGQQDDGRGLARSKVLKFKHEQNCGRTSTITHHIMGFDEKDNPVHQIAPAFATPLVKNKSWQHVITNSHHTVTFIDLAGHEKYLKTTVCGLSGCFPHYVCVIVGANMGVSRMTREHIGLAVLLDIPFFVVVNKVDISPENILKQTLNDLFKLVKSSRCGKSPYIVKKSKNIKTVIKSSINRICPIFLVSTVKGTNIILLNKYLNTLKPTEQKTISSDDHVMMEIDDTFNVTGIGLVISGIIHSGRIELLQQLKIGPFEDGLYRPIGIKGIHIKRIPSNNAKSGTVCTLALRIVDKRLPVRREMIRKGMFITNNEPKPCKKFIAEIFILYHSSTIKDRFQAVVHCGAICQTIQMELEEGILLRSGDKAIVKMRFMSHPEYIIEGTSIVLRESSTKAFGKVLSILH